jgi:hypothetical protein
MLMANGNFRIGKSILEFVPVPWFTLLCFVIEMAALWALKRAVKLPHVKRDDLQPLCGTFCAYSVDPGCMEDTNVSAFR